MSIRTRWGLALTWLAILLFGCSLYPAGHPAGKAEKSVPAVTTPTPTPAAADPQSASPAVGVQVGNLAPDFELTDLEGRTVRLSDYREQVVMVNFWAVWCGYCRTEFPAIQAAYERYQDQGFVVLAVNIQDKEGQVRDFVQDMGLTFPVLLDRRAEVTTEYRVRGLPTSFFVDQQGVIFEKHIGPVDEASLESYLAQLGPNP